MMEIEHNYDGMNLNDTHWFVHLVYIYIYI